MGGSREWSGWEIDLRIGHSPVSGPEFGTWIERIHPDDAEQVQRAIRNAAGSGQFEEEFRVLRRDGGISTIAAKGVRTESTRLVGVSQDITQRHASEKTRELLQGIIDHIPVMLCVYDPELQRFELNREAQRVLGWTDADANEGDFLTKLYPDRAYRASAIEYMRQLTPGWREWLPRAKDGSKVHTEWANIRLSDDRIIGIGIDVRALRESEGRYRGLFESMQEGFHLSEIICNDEGKPVDWRFLAVNSAFERLTGTKREEALGRTAREVMPGYDCDYWVARFGEVALTGRAAQVDAFDGGRHWQSAAYSPRRGQFAVIFSDVTERKRSEAELARQKQAYETLAENAPEVIARFDAALRHIYINAYGAKVYGKAKEAILGKTNSDLGFPEWHVRGSEADMRTVFATGKQLTVDFEFDSPSMGHQFFSCLLAPEMDERGEVASILAITRDVTEQKRAVTAREELIARLSEAVREADRNHSELEAVLQAMQDGVAVFDMQGSVVFVNQAQVKIGAYPTGDQIPRGPREFARILELRRTDGSVVPLEERPVARVLRGESVYDLELRGRRFDTGQEWHFSFSGKPVFEPGGRQILAVIIMRDITDRTRAEERVRQSQKLESVGLLAGGIAHDFNNLLTGILGNASMALDEVQGSAAERIREAMSSAERAANLTRQLLAYSGKGQFVVRDINVSEAVTEIAGLVEFSIPKSVQLAVTVQRRLPPARMAPSQLQQVVMNLVINAGEAIGEGKPGKITVATSMADVERRFVDSAGVEVMPGRYVCVEVTDTGSGIEEDKRSRIFDPFFTTKFTGRGLGLAAVAGIVRAQKGGITVESERGRGTRFRVYLPASDGWVESDAGPGGTDGGAAILVVDDEVSVRNFIGAVLRKKGYRVFSAADGREALTVFDREGEAIAAVVLDVIMPVMGGNDAMTKLKELRPELKVLLTSGYSESEARRLCATYPGAAFIQKPYTAQQLGRAVEELLG
jgi:PAS domain S-box-containing protein